MNFSQLHLRDELLHAISEAGFKTPTKIQTEAIPRILEGGDLIASAQTGTGKTAAFSLPILQKLSQKNFKKNRPIRALIIVPTRELSAQVGANIKELGSQLSPKLRCVEVFGGVPIASQEFKLKQGCDILVATPGRLLDLMEQRIVKLDFVEILVMDEGDRLLELGFQPDIRKVAAQLHGDCQKLLFSATVNDDVERMGAFILKRPHILNTITENVVVEKIKQVAHYMPAHNKTEALKVLFDRNSKDQILVFVNKRNTVKELGRDLNFAGHKVGTMHGEVDQRERAKVLRDFVAGEYRILVCTDVAARGLHIPDLPLVINYDVPQNSDDYVHRIGRTGRSGSSGKAISLATQKEMFLLEDIEAALGERIERRKIAGFKVGQEPSKREKGAAQKSGQKSPSRAASGKPGGRSSWKKKTDQRKKTKSKSSSRRPAKSKGRAPGSKANPGKRK